MHRRRAEEDELVTPWLVLLAFVVLVAVLAVFGSSRTRGRGCCAPADPAADRRMHRVLDDQ
jgi:hypothetical protein